MGVLLLLITIVGVIAAFILLSISIFTKKNWLRKFVLGTGAGGE
jgi:type II secretory pathway pseudopilin PulG